MKTANGADDAPAAREGFLARLALGFTGWAERWFPDAYVFAALAVILVSVAALTNGAKPLAVAKAFGDGFWSLITFTMQMAFVVIGGYVAASSPPVARLIQRLASIPGNGRSAIAFVAFASMLASLLNWGFSLIFGGLLVRALARRGDLTMDYRAAGAAAYLEILGATWALGLSSSAAQLQSNAASMPKPLLAITGVIPFTQTIFLWQSMLLCGILIVVSTAVAWLSVLAPVHAVTAEKLGVEVQIEEAALPPRQRPSEWLEYSPLITDSPSLSLTLGLAVAGILHQEPRSQAISGLNTTISSFWLPAFLLHWRPRSFLNAVAKSVPATARGLIQFPLYGAITMILTKAQSTGGLTVSDQLAYAFTSLNTAGSFPAVMGGYSAVLGFLLPSGGGKWLVEAPYVMQAVSGPSCAPRMGGAGL